MQLEELEDVVTEHYHIFVSTLLMRIGATAEPSLFLAPFFSLFLCSHRAGTSNGMSEPLPSEQACTTLRSFIKCAKDETLEAALGREGSWAKFSQPDYHRAITNASACVHTLTRLLSACRAVCLAYFSIGFQCCLPWTQGPHEEYIRVSHALPQGQLPRPARRGSHGACRVRQSLRGAIVGCVRSLFSALCVRCSSRVLALTSVRLP